MTTSAADITWTTDDLPREMIERILGADIVRDYCEMEPSVAIAHAECRRAGWWTANERDYHAAYASLITLLRAS